MKRTLGMLAIVCPLGATCLPDDETNTVTTTLPGTVTINSGTLTNSVAPTCHDGYVLVAEGGVMSRSWIKCAPRGALVDPQW